MVVQRSSPPTPLEETQDTAFWTSPASGPASFEYKYHPQQDKQTRGIDATNRTSSQQREYPTFWKRIHKEFIFPSRYFFTVVPNGNFMLILMFYFDFDCGCCCSPSSPLSFFLIACILVCVLLDSNVLVGTLCCNIAPCDSPCIFERYVHWVVVCCTKNNKQKEEVLLLWVEQFLVYLPVCPVI